MLRIGVDGCPGGWLVAALEQNKLSWFKVAYLEELLWAFEKADLCLIDMPIGLLSSYRKGGRICDQMARRHLPKSKKSSIFSAPPRSILEFDNYQDCCVTMKAEGGGLSLQSFYLLPKIRELDQFIRKNPRLNILEAHPELVFIKLGLIDGPNKKSVEGHQARLKILEQFMGQFQWPPPQGFPKEDCIDALALALRARQGQLMQVDSNPSRDTLGIKMQIHF